MFIRIFNCKPETNLITILKCLYIVIALNVFSSNLTILIGTVIVY